MLNDFENKYKGTKQGIVNSFLAILPLLQDKEKGLVSEIDKCQKCGEAANLDICNASKMKEIVKNAR